MIYAQAHTLSLIEGGRLCDNRTLLLSRFTDPELEDEQRRSHLAMAITQKLPLGILEERCRAYDAFLNAIPGVLRIYARNQSRLLLNMSGGVLENAGCSLDRFTGLPRIPGSAVKGVTRHAALDQLKENCTGTKTEALAEIALAFGWISADWNASGDFAWACQDNWPATRATARQIIATRLNSDEAPRSFAGCIAFFDALPAIPQSHDLELDIVTSHHKNYYSEKQLVALDNEQPNPVVFPAISPGQTFGFALAPRPHTKVFDGLLSLSKNALLHALTTYGIGAKIAAGYGWFSFDETESQSISTKLASVRKKEADDQSFREALLRLPQLDGITSENIQASINTVEAFLSKWTGREGLQPIRDNLAKNRGRLPRLSPLDRIRARWKDMNEKAIINGEIKTFTKKNDEEKRAIVELLREPENLIWVKLRSGQKGQVATAVEAIRNYSKNSMNLGKMP